MGYMLEVLENGRKSGQRRARAKAVLAVFHGKFLKEEIYGPTGG